MTKYANPEWYDREDTGGISLDRCVLDLFGMKLDKSNRATFEWDGEGALTTEQQVYAGLDTQALLEVYHAAWTFLHAKELELGYLIPDDCTG
ncbi:hypothetical protein C8R43DRAFT_1130105 [Mycena crocata]|nr:hypothetical protein C8R43DRAFT_1130105 [Mycena crocata]